MKVAVIGAGMAGLVTAKTLIEFDHDVTILESAPDVGGVWGSTTGFVGLRTECKKENYRYSTLYMPRHFDPFPTKSQVQLYVEMYVAQHGLSDHLRLHTKVTNAIQVEEGTWNLTLCNQDHSSRKSHPSNTSEKFDHVVVCTGLANEALLPRFSGLQRYEKAGGQVIHSRHLVDVDRLQGKNVAIVGFGKVACELACLIGSAPHLASRTALVVEDMRWKLPNAFLGFSPMKLWTSRLMEFFFPFPFHLSGERVNSSWLWRFLAKWLGRPIRSLVLALIELSARCQQGLGVNGLVPKTPFAKAASQMEIASACPDIFDAIDEGKIKVIRDVKIVDVGVVRESGMGKDGLYLLRIQNMDRGEGRLRPAIKLTDNSVVPFDVVVCTATVANQFHFFSPDLAAHFRDPTTGTLLLHRHILPCTSQVTNLTFNGSCLTRLCPLTFEITALWIARYLDGRICSLPPTMEEMRDKSIQRISWMRQRRKVQNGIMESKMDQYTLTYLDELLDDLGCGIGWRKKMGQFFGFADQECYDFVSEKVMQMHKADVRAGKTGRREGRRIKKEPKGPCCINAKAEKRKASLEDSALRQMPGALRLDEEERVSSDAMCKILNEDVRSQRRIEAADHAFVTTPRFSTTLLNDAGEAAVTLEDHSPHSDPGETFKASDDWVDANGDKNNHKSTGAEESQSVERREDEEADDQRESYFCDTEEDVRRDIHDSGSSTKTHRALVYSKVHASENDGVRWKEGSVEDMKNTGSPLSASIEHKAEKGLEGALARLARSSEVPQVISFDALPPFFKEQVMADLAFRATSPTSSSFSNSITNSLSASSKIALRIPDPLGMRVLWERRRKKASSTVRQQDSVSKEEGVNAFPPILPARQVRFVELDTVVGKEAPFETVSPIPPFKHRKARTPALLQPHNILTASRDQPLLSLSSSGSSRASLSSTSGLSQSSASSISSSNTSLSDPRPLLDRLGECETAEEIKCIFHQLQEEERQNVGKQSCPLIRPIPLRPGVSPDSLPLVRVSHDGLLEVTKSSLH